MVKIGYSGNFATRIAHNRIRRLDLDHVEKLCELFQCTPNDLLEWFPGTKDQNIDKHPLSSLRRIDKVVELTHMLSAIPLDKISEIENLIRKEIGQ